MNFVLHKFLERTIRTGTLQVVDAGGRLASFGDGGGTPVRVRFTSAAAERSIILNPPMKLGEEYMNGGYRIEAGTVYDLLALLVTNVNESWLGWRPVIATARDLVGKLAWLNTPGRSRQNVAHHYDLDGRLFDLFLDRDRQYSCAYFEPGNRDLDEAQLAKKCHLAAKLRLEPGMRVLDIGSGWGGLGLYLAGLHDTIDVTGVTLSEEQFEASNRRAREQGLDRRVRFLLKDYRAVDGPFDRIVSVGMFEHVGLKSYGAFFDSVAELLTENGIAVIHTIAKRGAPGPINSWMKKYIFPGAYLPTIAELGPPIARPGFWLTDLEIWRLHYAETLAAWNDRFQAKRDQAAALYDERFCRMWEFYLQVCEVAFRLGDLVVFQMQLARKIDSVPTTRDYMYEAEISSSRKRLQAAE